jgi:hypothetical protein
MRNDMFYLLVCYVSVNIPQFTVLELIKLIFIPILFRQVENQFVKRN